MIQQLLNQINSAKHQLDGYLRTTYPPGTELVYLEGTRKVKAISKNVYNCVQLNVFVPDYGHELCIHVSQIIEDSK